MRYLIIFLFFFIFFNSNSYAKNIIGTKLICTKSDNSETGYYFNRPKSLIRYTIPIYYDGITEKVLRSVYRSKWNYNPSPLKIFMSRDGSFSYSTIIDRTNLNLIIEQRNRTEKVIGSCKLMDNSFNMLRYFQEKTNAQYEEIITSKKRKF